MSAREIREKIKDIAGNQGMTLFTAEVLKVEGATCTVEYAETQLSGVKLFSIAAEGEFLLKPAIGSMVTVADLSGGLKRDLCLVKIDKIEQIKLAHNGLVFDIDAKNEKFEISIQGVSLKSLFTDLTFIMKSLKVMVLAPNAPSGTVTLDTLNLINSFEMDFKRLLK